MNIKDYLSVDRNEGWLMLANFIRETGAAAAYLIGIFGYAAYGFGGNPATVMYIMLVINIAIMVGNFIGGGLVDKIGPRKTILFSSITVVLVSFTALMIEGDLTSFLIFTGVYGICITVLSSGYLSFAPYLEKGKEGLRRVNSFLTMGTFIAAIVGAAVGAVIAEQFSVYAVFILLAVVTAIAALVTLRVKEKYSPDDEENEGTEKEGEVAKIAEEHDLSLTEPIRPVGTSVAAGNVLVGRTAEKRRVKKENPFGEAIEGWRIIRNSRTLKYYLAVAIAIVFGFGAFDALEPLYFKQILQVDISAIGWVNAVGGFGMIIGIALLATFPPKWISSRLLIFLMVLCGVGSVIYVATLSLVWVAVGNLILSFVFGIFDPLLRTLVQADTPLEAVGRVLGTINIIVIGLLLIPLVISPWLAELLGVQQVLILMGALPIAFAALLYPSGRKLDREAAGSRQIEGVDIFE